MGKSLPIIVEGDDEWDILLLIVEACGLDYREFLKNKALLTQDIFESHYKDIMKIVDHYSFSHNTYLIIGYLILRTGARLSNELREKIIDATNFDKYEKDYWMNNRHERKFFLTDLREKISVHKSGQITYLAEESLVI